MNYATCGILVITAFLSSTVASRAQCLAVADETLLSSNAQAYDHFGTGTALYGEWAMVGSNNYTEDGEHDGGVLVFHRGPAGWEETQILVPAEPLNERTWFGRNIELLGNQALISASRSDHQGVQSGAIYYFEFDGVMWVERQVILASNGSSTDRFGSAMDVLGDLLIVGALGVGTSRPLGAAYLFRFDGDTWNEEVWYRNPSSDSLLGSYGKAVALGHWQGMELACVSSHSFDGGFVATYCNDGSGWVAGPMLVPSDPTDDYFGDAMSADGDVFLFSARYGPGLGSVYSFRYDGINWLEEQRIVPAVECHCYDQFGKAIAIENDLAFIGRNQDTIVFRRHDNQWFEQGSLQSPWGGAIAPEDRRVLIGDLYNDEVDTRAGGADYYELPPLVLSSEIQALPPDGMSVDRALIPGYSLELFTCLGLPQSPVALFVVEAAGVPTFVPLLITSFDGAGKVQLGTTLPAGIANFDLSLAALGFATPTDLEWSNTLPLIFE